MGTGVTDILVGPATSIVIPDTTDYERVMGLVDLATSWEVLDQEEMERYGSGPWDGRVHLFNRWTKLFPTGLLRRVVCMIMSQGSRVRVYDERVYPDLTDCEVVDLNEIRLWKYQRKAVREGILRRSGVFCMPPASGKTEILISVVASLQIYPTLWLTHTDTLLDQSYKRFCRRYPHEDVEIGVIGGGVWDPKDITISTWQSLNYYLDRARPLIQDAKVIICDECHRVPARCWYKLMLESTALFRYGCSATPFSRGDGSDMRLQAAIGGEIFHLTPLQGEQIGIFLRPRVLMVEYDKTVDAAESCYLEWEELYCRGIVFNQRRNEAIAEIVEREVSADRQILILVQRIVQHGRKLEQQLKDRLCSRDDVVFLYGDTTRKKRDAAVNKFRRKELKVLIATSIFDEGADIPEIDTVIVAAGGKSEIRAIQRGGRGMRQAANKTEFRLYDFVDRYHQTLHHHSTMRAISYSSLASSVETFSLSDRRLWI